MIVFINAICDVYFYESKRVWCHFCNNLATGFVFALLDLLDILKLGFLSMAASNCAQTGSVTCLQGLIATMMLFLVDVITGPIILAANLMTNPFLGIVGVALGLIVLYFSFGQGGYGGSF